MTQATANGLRACAVNFLFLLFACGTPPSISQGHLQTLADLAGPQSLLPQAVTPRGQVLQFLSPPFAPTASAQAADADGLTIFPAFVDARPAAYVVTEIWDQWPRVWAQPVYQLVTALDPIKGPAPLPGARVIFSVGPGSRFYSPYWQVYYVLVPDGFRPDALTSVADVLDSKLPLAQGPNVYWTIGPEGLGTAHAQGAKPLRPLTQDPLLLRLPERGWFDGQPVSFLSFGRDRFRADDKHVVAEAVLYQFALRGPDGQPVPLDLPRVGGTGAFRAPRPVDAPQGIPQFGALWHEFTAMLATRPGDPLPGVFVPAAMPALRARVVAMMGDARFAPLPGPVAEGTPEKAEFILRVAIDGACFGQGDFPNGCTWLDTQASVENNLPGAAFTDTKRLTAGALVFFDGTAP